MGCLFKYYNNNVNKKIGGWLKMIKQICLTLILLTLLTITVVAQDDIGREKMLELFNIEDSKVEELFDQSFLNQIPIEQIIKILNSYQDRLGVLSEVTGENGIYTLVFTKGTAPAQLSLNTDNKIIGIWFGNMDLSEDNMGGIISELEAIEGSVSVSVVKNNQQNILSYNADKEMAVGSSFKLLVLKAVYDAVEKGDITWGSVISLDRDSKSLPSGILQNWPEGTPLTIKTLTNMMISISDNTATDILINTIGRRNIEKYVTDINIPFLKTIDLFRLKYAANSATQEEYLNAATDEKRDILNDIKDMTVEVSSISGSPKLINELEWFFTTHELSKLIYDLREADELGINPGLAVKEDWNMVGYKGGSEPGVLQYTHILQKAEEGDIYTVSLTVNNPNQELDNSKITELTSRIISLIKHGKI